MPVFPHIFSTYLQHMVYVNKKIMFQRKRSRKINGEQRMGGKENCFPASHVLQGSEIRTQGTLLSCSTPDLPLRRKREGKATSYRIIVTRSLAKSVKRPLKSQWTHMTGFPVCLFVLAVIVLESSAYARGENAFHSLLSSTGSHINYCSLAENCGAPLRITKLNIYLPAAGM